MIPILFPSTPAPRHFLQPLGRGSQAAGNCLMLRTADCLRCSRRPLLFICSGPTWGNVSFQPCEWATHWQAARSGVRPLSRSASL